MILITNYLKRIEENLYLKFNIIQYNHQKNNKIN